MTAAMTSTPPGPDSPAAAATVSHPLIRLEDVRLSYGTRVVLDRVTFDIAAGQFWCLLGPNGEGKTTLIKALLGALRPNRGRILRRGDVFRRRRVSYVPQRLDLNPALPTTVREFITSGLAGLPSDATMRQTRLRRVLDLVGLGASALRNYWTLSGGQRQRALVARALIRDPSLLIIDEPTAGLDLAAAEAVLAVLRDLHRQYQVTIVFVTHDLQIAADHATHVAMLRGGAVTAGSTPQVFTESQLERTFGVPIRLLGNDRGGLRVAATSREAR